MCFSPTAVNWLWTLRVGNFHMLKMDRLLKWQHFSKCVWCEGCVRKFKALLVFTDSHSSFSSACQLLARAAPGKLEYSWNFKACFVKWCRAFQIVRTSKFSLLLEFIIGKCENDLTNMIYIILKQSCDVTEKFLEFVEEVQRRAWATFIHVAPTKPLSYQVAFHQYNMYECWQIVRLL